MQKQIEASEIIKKLLAARGYTDPDEIAEYLSPHPQKTYDPLLMKGMEEASEIILEYAHEKKKICIYGDYDADGITSVSLMMTLLGYIDADAFFYIPSRFEEGYGLNMDAIKKVAGMGAKLVVTVDCGCTSPREVEYIKELGMLPIVTDHHNIGEEVPDCIMLNPKQKDCEYPFAYLCGCGVAFKLAQTICKKAGIPKAKLNALLDLVGIATVGDIVPLRDENRTLVKYGICRMRRKERLGLDKLLTEIKLDGGKVNSENIAFGIVPHLNACGRLMTGTMGVELLTASDGEEARQSARKLAELNLERRNLQESTYKLAVEHIDAEMSDDRFIFYDAKDAHEGITGIVAGKLKDKYYRPVVIVTDTKDPDIIKGTGRSIEGIDLHAVLKKYSDFYVKFGGHAGACGFSMYRKHADELRAALNADVSAMLKENPDLLTYHIKEDLTIDADDVTLALAREIKLMEPFGEGNRRPIFKVENITVNSVYKMGKEGQYRKFACVGRGGNFFDAIVFDTEIKAAFAVTPGDSIAVYGEVSENVWNQKSSVQLVVRGVC